MSRISFSRFARRGFCVRAAGSPASPSSKGQRLRASSMTPALVLAIAASALSVGVIGPAQASAASRVTGYAAASRITGCFNYNGVAVSRLYALAEVYSFDSRQWKAVPGGALGLTNSNGCVAFNIAPGWQRTYMRISAIGYVPSWNLIVTGTTPSYGPADGRGWYLGNASMAGYRAPAPVRSGSLTGSWLDGMTGSSSGPSSAMRLASWIDRKLAASPRLRANVVVNTCRLNGRSVIC